MAKFVILMANSVNTEKVGQDKKRLFEMEIHVVLVKSMFIFIVAYIQITCISKLLIALFIERDRLIHINSKNSI